MSWSNVRTLGSLPPTESLAPLSIPTELSGLSIQDISQALYQLALWSSAALQAKSQCRASMKSRERVSQNLKSLLYSSQSSGTAKDKEARVANDPSFQMSMSELDEAKAAYDLCESYIAGYDKLSVALSRALTANTTREF